MIRPLIILGLASLILQGCAELSWPPRGEATVPADAASSKSSGAAAESPPTPPRKPSQTAALPATSQEPSDGQPKPEVGSLLGLDFAAVRELLGVPALEEIQAPATVWVYNGRGCVLNIFFYPHVDGGEYRALTYDVKSAEQAPESSQRCFDELLQDLKKAEVN